MSGTLHVLFAPGFFSSAEVWHALELGTLVAVISGVVGVFTVILAVSHLQGTLSAILGRQALQGRSLIGANAIWGFIGVGVIAGVVLDLLGQRPRERDVTTGIVLGFVLGVGALFLFFDTWYTNTTGAPVSILFGSLFLINTKLIPLLVILAFITLALILVIYRPLLLSALNPELANARGVPVRWVSVLFMSAMAMAVEQSAIVVGALLSTALLMGPAATAVRMTKRTGAAMVISACIGVIATILGIILSYDSYTWTPVGTGWPVSFFITALVLGFYLLSLLPGLHARRGTVAQKGIAS